VVRVTEREADAVTELFALAFNEDPVWSWAFPDDGLRLEQHRALWGLLMHSAVPYGHVWTDGAAAAMWIPPGRPELNAQDEARLEPLLRSLIGERAGEVMTLLERFEENHPRHTPHYYLSLLGTHPAHRGAGRGMGLLAANLAEMDAHGIPSYLESSNPANDARYARLGYERVGSFGAPGGGPALTCMWRDAR
jgi:GNAT superfamily N-acetyltransferase